MKITAVTVRKDESSTTRMRGKATVTLDDCFVIHGIRIIEGNEGLFIAMPSIKTANGEHKDIVHPINTETRQMFLEAIIEAYDKAE